ncbi:hypothetical protein CNYM01_04383 [Colletotrichum nymphaeae SA-01]|uniref:Uncharacterized protein n=1 Tax=Colletotrichum nymphaeae SA-01 TaxID=1460502 RepID=A0A135RU74_9PEZI|nr:hypothetical protein CNYM01_04383 [Colletotrichum nymphaeae SA-01]
MTKPRRSKRLSQLGGKDTTLDRFLAQNELSGCVTPNDVYLHAPENETRDTSYDDAVNVPFHDPILDTIYAYPYGFPGDDFTWTGPTSTWDEVANTTPQDPDARSIH